MKETLFYVFGIALAVSAVVTSFIGLKVEGFPGKAMPLVIVWFAILIGGAGTFAVLHGKDEDKTHAVEYAKANEEIEEGQSGGTGEGGEAGPAEGSEEPAEGEESEESGTSEEGAGDESGPEGEEPSESSEELGGGATSTLKLEADETELAFDTTELEAKSGKVTIDLKNPSTIPHNIAIDKGGEEIAVSETVASAETAVTAELEPGTYTFLCTIPGHAEAGMEGTLVVK